jgi:hypothetical protein
MLTSASLLSYVQDEPSKPGSRDGDALAPPLPETLLIGANLQGRGGGQEGIYSGQEWGGEGSLMHIRAPGVLARLASDKGIAVPQMGQV